jgi:hypothetical protein
MMMVLRCDVSLAVYLSFILFSLLHIAPVPIEAEYINRCRA